MPTTRSHRRRRERRRKRRTEDLHQNPRSCRPCPKGWLTFRSCRRKPPRCVRCCRCPKAGLASLLSVISRLVRPVTNHVLLRWARLMPFLRLLAALELVGIDGAVAADMIERHAIGTDEVHYDRLLAEVEGAAQ